jgi:hypothetical protein
MLAVVALAAIVPAYAGYDKFYRFKNSTGSTQTSVGAMMMGMEIIGAQFTDDGTFNPWGVGASGTDTTSGVCSTTLDWSGASAPAGMVLKLGWNSTDHSLQLRDFRWGNGTSITPTLDNSSVPGGGVLTHVGGYYYWTIINDTTALLYLARPDGTSTVEAGSFSIPLGMTDVGYLSEQGISGQIIAVLIAEVNRASGNEIPAPSANSLLKKLRKAADALNLALRALENGDMATFETQRAAAVKAMQTFVSELRTSGKIPLDYRNRLAAAGDEAIARLNALPQGAIPSSFGGGNTIPTILYPIGDPRGPSQFTLVVPDSAVIPDVSSLVIHGSVVDQHNSTVYVDWVDRVEVKSDLDSPTLTVNPFAAGVPSLSTPPVTYEDPDDELAVTVAGSDIGSGVVGLYVLEGEGTPPNAIPGVPQYQSGNQLQRSYGLGTHWLVAIAKDGAGNLSDQKVVKVRLVDKKAPKLTVPPDVTAEQANRNGTTVGIGQATATDRWGAPVITNNAPKTFPLGVTIVTWKATDKSGNVATGTQEVTVVDTTPPVLRVPADIRQEQTSLAGTEKVNLGTATATDICDADVEIINNAPKTFPLGTTVVKWTATDKSGKVATATQSVTVIDTTPPAIEPPTDLSAEQTDRAGTPVTLTPPTATDICDADPAVTNDAPAVFPLGETTVTWTATDDSGNKATATQKVTVVDTTAPTLTVLDGVSDVEQANRDGTAVDIGQATASDICDAAPAITNDAPAVFPLGETTVTWTATDASGNKTTATRKVTVVDTTVPTIQSLTANPNAIWSPNHKMVTVTVTAVSTDVCDAAPTCKITSVECPQGGASQITGAMTVKLDAWRDPKNPDGRLYTIHVACTDASGNLSVDKTVDVRVAHDQGGDKTSGAAAVSSLSAVPTRAGAQIVFALGAPSQVSVTVLNLAGRPVRTLCDAKAFGAGMNTLAWNAQADNGLRVPNGTYLIRLTANSPDGTTSRAISPVRLSR